MKFKVINDGRKIYHLTNEYYSHIKPLQELGFKFQAVGHAIGDLVEVSSGPELTIKTMADIKKLAKTSPNMEVVINFKEKTILVQ